MANIRLRDIEGYENFKAECSFFKCEEEYPGWTGKEKYGIITGLTKEELEAKYPQVIVAISPYILLDSEFGRIRAEAKRNEHKHEMRAKRTISIFEMDEEAEAMHSELASPDFISEMIEKQENDRVKKEKILLCREILSHLNDKQKERIVKYYILNKTIEEIAEEECCTPQAISQAILRAKKTFTKYAEKPFNSGTPLCMHYEGVSSILKRITASTEIKSNEN